MRKVKLQIENSVKKKYFLFAETSCIRPISFRAIQDYKNDGIPPSYGHALMAATTFS
jgi:hypothetical protein